MKLFMLLLSGWLLTAAGCDGARSEAPVEDAASAPAVTPRVAGVLTAAFVALDGVYNSELMAPYDVLQHTVFRDSVNYITPFIVTPDGAPFVTFEGLTITPHHSFATAPHIDILVLPSTEGSMGRDLRNERLMTWLGEAVGRARYVLTTCDGAFPLAATGALDGRMATTFPADRDRLAEQFPAVDVQHDTRLVVDGKYITSVGGGMSYEPAFYLVEHLYGPEHATRSAEGLVWDWDLARVPHRVASAPVE